MKGGFIGEKPIVDLVIGELAKRIMPGKDPGGFFGQRYFFTFWNVAGRLRTE